MGGVRAPAVRKKRGRTDAALAPQGESLAPDRRVGLAVGDVGIKCVTVAQLCQPFGRHEACSGYVTSPALVTPEGLAKLGDSNAFDPDIPYREAYATIWGK
ncbi:MAG: hypothetical protein AAF822_18115 [Pseudomonadota bacterium]